MERKTNEGKLNGLPSSDNKFWEDAEKIPSINQVWSDSTKCKHEFRSEGNKVQCNKCSWGFFLTGETEFKDGHVYRTDGKLLI